MVLHRVNVEELLEGDLGDLFSDFLILDQEAILLGIQHEISLVVEREGEEFDFFGHLVEVTFDFVFQMLWTLVEVS